MNCIRCETGLTEGTRFCPACGQPVDVASATPAPVSERSCAGCSSPLAPGAAFCAECGCAVQAPPAEPGHAEPGRSVTGASPHDLVEYQSLIAAYASDGVLEKDELESLAELRRQFGVSEDQHRQLLAKYAAFCGMPIQIDLDPESAYLVARQPSALLVAVRNPCAGALDILERFAIQFQCATSGVIRGVEGGRILPGKRRVVSMSVDAPPSPGQFNLDGILTAHFRGGRVFRGTFHLPLLRAVEASAPDHGPSHVSVSVDARSAALVKGIGNLGSSPAQATGQLRSASGTWERLSVRGATEDDLDRWRVAHSIASVPGTLLPLPPVQGEPLPCRGVLLRVKRSGANGAQREIWFMRDDRVVFGRDGTQADLVLAVEPYLPPHLHPENVAHSKQISSRHIEVRRTDTGASIRDLGSTNGTSLDQEMLKANQQSPIEGPLSVCVGEVLTLRAECLRGDPGAPHVVELRRVDNLPLRSYLLASGGIGLWPARPRLIGPRRMNGHDAPAILNWQAGGPCLRNISLLGLRVGDQRLAVGQNRALDHRDLIHVGEAWLVYVHEVLPERYAGVTTP